MATSTVGGSDFTSNLGRIYTIYTGGFIAFIILMAILSAFGVPNRVIGYLFMGFTIVIYAVIGILSRTMQVGEYYVAGRRVPALYNGMATGADWMSAASFIGMAGSLYLLGYDGLGFVLGWTGGYVLVAILVAPYLRKFGAYTVPDFLSARYGGNFARLIGVVVLFSFHSTAGLTLPFEGFSTRWYEEVFGDSTFSEALVNSLILGAGTAIVAVGLATPAAYGVARSRSRAGTPLQLLFLAPVLLPGLFIGAALLSFLGRIQFERSLLTVLIAHVVFAFPFVFLLMRTALERLDPALEEVARDLGASRARVFWRVILPQIAAVLGGAAALAFMLSFDEFLITFFVIGDEQTLPVYIFGRLRRTVDPGINVASTLLLAVVLFAWLAAAFATVRAMRAERRREQIGAAA